MAKKTYYENSTYEMATPKAISKKGFKLTPKNPDINGGDHNVFKLTPALDSDGALYDSKKTLVLSSTDFFSIADMPKEMVDGVLKLARQYAMDNNCNLVFNMCMNHKYEDEILNNVKNNGLLIPMTFSELRDVSKVIDKPFDIDFDDFKNDISAITTEMSSARKVSHTSHKHDFNFPDNVKFNLNVGGWTFAKNICMYDEKGKRNFDLSNISLNNVRDREDVVFTDNNVRNFAFGPREEIVKFSFPKEAKGNFTLHLLDGDAFITPVIKDSFSLDQYGLKRTPKNLYDISDVDIDKIPKNLKITVDSFTEIDFEQIKKYKKFIMDFYDRHNISLGKQIDKTIQIIENDVKNSEKLLSKKDYESKKEKLAEVVSKLKEMKKEFKLDKKVELEQKSLF